MKKEEERKKLSEWLNKIKMPEELRKLYQKNLDDYSKNSHVGNKSIHFFDKVYESFPKFYLKSGEIALTTIGILKYCYKIMWEFPKGSFKLQLGRKGKYDVALISFKDTFEDTIQLHMFFKTAYPEENTPSTLLLPIINGSGSQLSIIDYEIWNQEKTSIYDDDEDIYDLFCKLYKMLFPGEVIIFNLKDEYSENLTTDYYTTHEYKAFAGFDKDSEILYLLLQCYSENYKTKKSST